MGKAKTEGSGRKKGTPNKNTLPLQALADRLGVDPFEILLHFAAGDWAALGYKKGTRTILSMGRRAEIPVIPPEMRVKAATEAAQYLHPKRKAIEIAGSSDENAAPVRVVMLPSNGREAKN